MQRKELIAYLNEYLNVPAFKDVSLNGLQVEGFSECTSIATATTASLETIDAAIEEGVDTLIVHHGLLWRGQNFTITGAFRERINSLLEANINLLAYHLPLDANLVLGNNRYLCDLAGLTEIDYIEAGNPQSIAMQGILPEPKSVGELAKHLSVSLNTRVEVLGNVDEQILLSRIGVCSGSGAFLVDEDLNQSFDAVITGDVKEQTYHLAKETGTPVFVLGHHASEQGGIKKLGEHLARRFDLEHHHLHFSLEKETKLYVE